MRRYPTTPLWLKLSVAVVLLGSVGWWALDRADRIGNEHRLAAIASQIAGREVTVHCPGPIGRALAEDQLEGSVQFDADGKPANGTRLRKTSCAELDALAEGRRGKELACTERAGILCGRHGRELAMAVEVITHESWHLRGIRTRAGPSATRCRRWARPRRCSARRPARRAALARGQLAESYPLMPDQYRSEHAPTAGAFDLRPDDSRWP